MKRNISLDFFRGVMAIAVALGHFFYWNNQADKMPLSFILAVDFFLVLSGFVISASVFNKKHFDTYRFIQNRYFRLAPVYLFCVFVTLLPQYFLAQNFAKPNSLDVVRILAIGEMLPMNHLRFVYFEPLGIAYTISAEFWVGIILFPTVFVIRKYISQLLLPFLTILIWFAFLKITNDSPAFMNIHYAKAYPFVPSGIIRCILDYGLGIIAYIIYEQQNNRTTEQQSNRATEQQSNRATEQQSNRATEQQSNRATEQQSNRATEQQLGATFFQIAVLALCFLLYRKVGYNRVNEFIFPFICGCFIISLAKRRGLIFNLFDNKIGHFFGDISYPIYLIHPLFIDIFQWTYQEINYTMGCIYIVLNVVAAFIIHKWIEKPCMIYFSKRINLTVCPKRNKS